MQADVEMLRRQRSDLEDQELEVMEAREALDARARRRSTPTRPGSAPRSSGCAGIIAAAEAEIDAELAEEDAAWATQAAVDARVAARRLPAPPRAEQGRGRGPARRHDVRRCHLSIPSTEAEQIRRAAGATVAYCDNCGAILVP